MLEYWSTGVLEYWSTGILEYWNTEVLEYWNTGILEYCRSGGALHFRDKTQHYSKYILPIHTCYAHSRQINNSGKKLMHICVSLICLV